jgi:hypothetical protein
MATTVHPSFRDLMDEELARKLQAQEDALGDWAGLAGEDADMPPPPPPPAMSAVEHEDMLLAMMLQEEEDAAAAAAVSATRARAGLSTKVGLDMLTCCVPCIAVISVCI